MSTRTLIITGCIAMVALVIAAVIIYKIFPNENEVETETLYCGENNTKPVKVFKSPTKAFPSFAREYNAKINGSVEVIDSIEKSLGIKSTGAIDLNNKLIELREKLNQESARMEMIMKSNFFAYNSNPCDSSVTRSYFALLNSIAEKNNDLEKFRAELTIPINKGGTNGSGFKIVTDTAIISRELSRLFEEYKFEK